MPSAREFTVRCFPTADSGVRFPDALQIARYHMNPEDAHLNHGLLDLRFKPKQKYPAKFSLTFPSKKAWANFVVAHRLTCEWTVGGSAKLRTTRSILNATEFQLLIISLLNSFKDNHGQAVVLPRAYVSNDELEKFYTAASHFCLAIKRFFNSKNDPDSTACALVVGCLQTIYDEWDEYWSTKSPDYEVPRTADDVYEEDLLNYLLDKLAILDLTQHLEMPGF